MFRFNDSFKAGEERFNQKLREFSDPEPIYQSPKTWPHQVPPEKRVAR
jgi:hypothetical protein